MRYYDKEFNELNLFQWAEKFEDFDYRRIALHEMVYGSYVSAIWMGMDVGLFGLGWLDFAQSDSGYRPLIFELMTWVDGRVRFNEKYNSVEMMMQDFDEQVKIWDHGERPL